MIRKCGWCRKDMGESEPLKDKSETTGICDFCAWIFKLEVEFRSILESINYSSILGLEMMYIVYNQIKWLNRIKKFRDSFVGKNSRIRFANE